MPAKSLQSCPTLCNPMDYGPPGSSVGGILQQEYWSGLPCLPPGNLPSPGVELPSFLSPALAGRFFTTSATYLWGEYLFRDVFHSQVAYSSASRLFWDLLLRISFCSFHTCRKSISNHFPPWQILCAISVAQNNFSKGEKEALFFFLMGS